MKKKEIEDLVGESMEDMGIDGPEWCGCDGHEYCEFCDSWEYGESEV